MEKKESFVLVRWKNYLKHKNKSLSQSQSHASVSACHAIMQNRIFAFRYIDVL